MLLNRISVYFTSLICIGLVYMLFVIKDNVMKLNKEYEMIKRQISYEHNAMKMLKSELSYLSSPERLQALSSKYLPLESVQVAQIISDYKNIEKNDMRIASSNNIKPHNVKWRRKKVNIKYSTKISYTKK